MKDHFLGIPFYRFYYKRPKEIFDLARRLKFNPTNTTNCIWEGVKDDGLSGSDLHKLPAFGNFFEWVQECLDEVATDLKMTTPLRANAAWAHLNRPGEHLYLHNHNNCFVSSNYYVSGSSEDHTVWYYPNPYYEKTNMYPGGEILNEEEEDIKYSLVHKEPTEPGKYIVFPPTIPHKSECNSSSGDRITLAADAFPTGLVNRGGTSRLMVNVL